MRIRLAASVAGLLVATGASLAGAGPADAPTERAATGIARAQEASAAAEERAPEAADSSSERAAETHGACVSAQAHAARDAGLLARGEFVSAVARSEDAARAHCDFTAELSEALAKQTPVEAPARGAGNAVTRGKSAQHRPAR